MARTTIIPLSEPVSLGDDQFSELTIEEPRGGAIREVGTPFRIDFNGELEIFGDKMSAMIARQSKKPIAVIDNLSMADWMEAAHAVVGFMGQSGATTDPSSQTTGSSSTTEI